MFFIQASNADELTVAESEMLEIVGPGDCEGWVKVSSSFSFLRIK